jgi:hypothetical protein
VPELAVPEPAVPELAVPELAPDDPPVALHCPPAPHFGVADSPVQSTHDTLPVVPVPVMPHAVSIVPSTHCPLRLMQPVHVKASLTPPPLLAPLLAPLEGLPEDPLPPPESVKKPGVPSLLPASKIPSPELLPLDPTLWGKLDPVSPPQADSGAAAGEMSTRAAKPTLEICMACLTGCSSRCRAPPMSSSVESGRAAPLLPYYRTVPAVSLVRALGGTSALFALVVSQPACSVLLNWDGYSGGALDAGDDVGTDPGSDAADAADAGVDAETGGDVTDASMDVGDSRPRDDGGVDASKPPCASSCGGCCDPNGNCFGGRSIGTCGNAGARCTDCANAGQVCALLNAASGGICAPPPQDSGPVTMTCTPQTCPKMLCVPFWQSACCKSDQTCGCVVVIPPGPYPCN